MTSELDICPECGNDTAVDGFALCHECLVGDIPEDWYVLWCADCDTTVAWTLEDSQTYPDDEWPPATIWATTEGHPTCFRQQHADAEREPEGKG